MKSLIIALVLVSGSAMAHVSQDADQQVNYLSWCEKNNVVAQAQDGQIYIRANCSESNLTCKAVETYRGFGKVVTATCQPAQ